MRSIHLAVLLGIMALATPILKAHADSDVLVPSDTGSNNAPNLGLMPSDSSSSPDGESTTPPAAPPSMPPYAPLSDTENTGAPTPPAASTSQSLKIPTLSQQTLEAVNAKAKEQVAKMQTMVIKSPDMTQILKSQSNLPNSVDVKITPKQLSAHSKQLVTEQLGISDPAVLSACRLSATGYIQGSKDLKRTMSAFDFGVQDRTTAKYDGQISTVIVMVRALCDMSQPLPPHKGVIFQVGDKYSASLGNTQCTAPNSEMPQGIVITVPENGTPMCEVR